MEYALGENSTAQEVREAIRYKNELLENLRKTEERLKPKAFVKNSHTSSSPPKRKADPLDDFW